MSWDQLAKLYKKSTLAFGQITNVDRLKRTIPHKFYEALYFGNVYVSRELYPLAKVMQSGENYHVLVAKTPQEASSEIMKLIHDEKKIEKLNRNMLNIILLKNP